MKHAIVTVFVFLLTAFSALCQQDRGQIRVKENTDTFNMCRFIDSDTLYFRDLACNIFTRQGLKIRVLHNGKYDTGNLINFSKRVIYQNHIEYETFTTTFQYDSLPRITLRNYFSPVGNRSFEEVKPGNLRDYLEIGNQKFVFDLLLYHNLNQKNEAIDAVIDSSYFFSLNKRKYVVIFIYHDAICGPRPRDYLVCAFDITDTMKVEGACLGLTECRTINMFGCYDEKYLDFLKIDPPNDHDYEFLSRHHEYPLDTLYWYRFDRGKIKKIKDKYLVVQGFPAGDSFPVKIWCDKSLWFDLRKYKNRKSG